MEQRTHWRWRVYLSKVFEGSTRTSISLRDYVYIRASRTVHSACNYIRNNAVEELPYYVYSKWRFPAVHGFRLVQEAARLAHVPCACLAAGRWRLRIIPATTQTAQIVNGSSHQQPVTEWVGLQYYESRRDILHRPRSRIVLSSIDLHNYKRKMIIVMYMCPLWL